jgi:hypothetical protein
MAETIETRVARLEEAQASAWRAIDALTDKETRLDEALATLIDAQIKTEHRFRETDERFREVAERFRDTDARFQETDTQIKELAKIQKESQKKIDERIQALVSAIGELASQRKQ